MKPSYFICTLGQAQLLQQEKPYCTIPEFIDYQAEHNADLPAVGSYIVDNNEQWQPIVLTFRDVQKAVHSIADRLRPTLTDPSTGDTVALLAPSSLEFLFVWLALMYLGRPVLLVAPQCSASSVAHLCDSCEVTLLFRDDQYEKLAREAQQAVRDGGRVIEIKDLPVAGRDDLSRIINGPPTPGITAARVTDSDVAYLHHTSGTSSGIPKPIPQTHRAGLGVLPRLEGSQEATFTTTPLYHGGIADMFRSWSSDAMIWLFPGKDAPITAKNVVRCLDISTASFKDGGSPRVTYFSSVPYVLQMLAADEKGLQHLQAMSMVGVGGAALASDAGHALVEKGINLVSRFGSAECGFLLSSQRDFDKDHDWQYLRHDPDITQLSFEPREEGLSELVIRSGWPHMAKTNREDGSFATSDLFEPHPSTSHAWKYHSRADSQLTLVTGKKFDPAPLEAAVVAASDMISDAMIFGEGEAYPGVLLFRSTEHSSTSDEEVISHMQPLVQKLNQDAQAHARIPKDMLVPMAHTELEKSSKGTLIRSALTKRFSDVIETAYRSESSDGSGAQPADEDIANAILEEVQALLPDIDELNADSDLFAEGVDSVASMQIRNKLHKFLPKDAKLPLTIVQDCGTICSLTEQMLVIRHGGMANPASTANVSKVMQRYVEKFSKPPPATSTSTSSGTNGVHERQQSTTGNIILLTGATGTLGAHLLAHLLHHHTELNISHIYVLVRKSSTNTNPTQRVKAALKDRLLDIPSEPEFSSLVTVLPSTLSSPQLDLDADIYHTLSTTVTHIYHLAWSVNFLLPLSAYRPHFAGLQNLLRLAPSDGKLKKFVFCSSTASVSAYADTFSIPSSNGVKDDIKPGESSTAVPESIITNPGVAGSTGYARSKWVGESICASFKPESHRASLRGKLCVVRVGQLSGSTQTGCWNATEAYPLMLAASRLLGVVPDLDAARSSKGEGIVEECAWLPVDIAAAAFAELGDFSTGQNDQTEPAIGTAGARPAEDTDTASIQVLHLLPKPGAHSTWTDIVHTILHTSPDTFCLVPIAEWLDKLQSLKAKNSSSPHPALQLLEFWREAYCIAGSTSGHEAHNVTEKTAADDRIPDQTAKTNLETKAQTTSNFQMQRSLHAMPVLQKRPATVHEEEGYIERCWVWISEKV